MPRRKIVDDNSAFRQVQAQARTLLQNLRKDIRAKEAELKRLREEEARFGRLVGGPGAMRQASSNGTGTATRGRPPASGSGRINWREVLDQVPKQFSASDVRSIRGLKGKRSSEIFAAITRWIEAGSVKRKSRGVYERV
ncbi:MAG TPA: hypothetical protein VMU41_17510 [Candidatus Binataceae bacterium]|nr:hypothetical protein [Candidatus Binataceae bacterium]